jgi:hypothetical protein
MGCDRENQAKKTKEKARDNKCAGLLKKGVNGLFSTSIQ